MNHHLEHSSKYFLHSSAQIMLQSNVVTGFLFLVGIGINSSTMLLGCTLAMLSSLAIVEIFQYDSDRAKKGFYGFNAALVGIAVFSLLPLNLISLFLVIFGGALSAFLMHIMMTKILNIPPLTAPFILTIWIIGLIIDFWEIPRINQGGNVVPLSTSLIDLLSGVLSGVGQVMLQGSWLSGAVFCCALLCSSYKTVVWVMLGSATGLLVAITFGFSHESATLGLYSFNGCLVVIALIDRYPDRYWLIFFALLSTVVLTRGFEIVAIPAFTAPFVIATWLSIGLVKFRTKLSLQNT
jgi:urea transporter